MKGRAERLSNRFKGHTVPLPLLSSPLPCLDLSSSETGKLKEEKYFIKLHK